MAVDKVKPLGFEEPTDGTETFPTPTELDPSEDYVAAKGFSFENLDNFLAEKVGGVVRFAMPTSSYKPTFLTNGDLDYVEIFDGNTQTTPYRRVKVSVAYDADDNPITETWNVYDPNDGTTILKTITLTHTWVNDEISKSEEAIA